MRDVFFVRVCVAEDKEGASLWDRGDLLLLYQIGDDRPRPRWNLWVLLLPRCVVIVLLFLLTDKQKVSVYIHISSNCKDKLLYDDEGYLVIFVIILFVSAMNK